jgi:hypothetical protein
LLTKEKCQLFSIDDWSWIDASLNASSFYASFTILSSQALSKVFYFSKFLIFFFAQKIFAVKYESNCCQKRDKKIAR